MKLNLCSEVVRELSFAEQCRFARETGYDGLEVAPMTLAERPDRLSDAKIAELRAIAMEEGVEIAGLHFLLVAPPGLSVTACDRTVADRTRDFGKRLVDLCSGLGGRYLVHGSPAQRVLDPGEETEGRANATAYFAVMGEAAAEAGVTYIVEPLSRDDTRFINTVDEALALIDDIGAPGLATMIDCYAAASNGENIPRLLERWVPSGAIRHIHFNDDNRRGPGEGGTDFAAIVDTLERLDFRGAGAVEPFVYSPDGPACAARAIGYLRGLMARR